MGGVSAILLIVLIVVRVIKYFSNKSYYEPARRQYTGPVHQKTAAKEPLPPGNPFYTNAPEHWGTITDEFLTSNKQFVGNFDEKKSDFVVSQREWMVNSLVLMGAINKSLEKKQGSKVHSSYGDALLELGEQYATTCCIEKLFEKGVIKITGIVIDNYDRYGVILCDKPTPMKYIEQLRTYFIQDGYRDLVYFATTDPAGEIADKPLKFENFNKNCFKFDKDKQGKEHCKYSRYAMWWAGETEPDFTAAVIKDDIRIYLDMLDFYNSYALGILSYAFGLKPDNSRTRLPKYDEVLIEGPEGVQIIISLSSRHGINFHFPMLPKYEQYRNKFIKVYVNFCYTVRAQIVEHDWPKDDLDTVSTLVWYNSLLSAAADSDGRITSLGRLGEPGA